jgi:hypothetical protein
MENEVTTTGSSESIIVAILVVCVITALVITYPDQSEISYENVAMFWRADTLDARNGDKIKVDLCLMELGSRPAGEPNIYNKGYVEFTTFPVKEGDQITIHFEKQGYKSLDITFVVPRLYPVGGQTYYRLAVARLSPILA